VVDIERGGEAESPSHAWEGALAEIRQEVQLERRGLAHPAELDEGLPQLRAAGVRLDEVDLVDDVSRPVGLEHAPADDVTAQGQLEVLEREPVLGRLDDYTFNQAPAPTHGDDLSLVLNADGDLL